MDLWDLTRLLLRRWYFAVPMLLASVAVVAGAAQTVAPDYKAMGYMQLIPAPSTGKAPNPNAKPRPANPWLDLGYAALGNAAALTVTNTTTLEKLAAEGYSDSITVVLNERTPLFEIEVVGDSREQASGTVQKIIKLLQDDIEAKQKQYGTLAEDTISTLVINDGSAPEVDSGTRKRVLIVAAGLGVLLTTASTIALDYWLRRRASRRDGSSGTPADAEPTPSEPASSSSERTQVIRPQPPAQPPRNNVYAGERRSEEQRNGEARKRSAPGHRAVPDAPVDSTVVLPVSHPSHRS
ncbi:hypothetical protein FHR83_001642 [Actinoplanes campanulatus]|uniref:Capsular polysaccharide biosynthesis protein n=1 Tax=Actinoplanes campanulatus TaxID=113559 RepID=A0A7W5AD51_9ACTN|nr:hypothetical protein [Actinoplanes campanulatus]MBB3093993.1 hypothetical protein [Actinoplanes campanulatus]GGN33399.1 hypothetical protein GCM10010109_55360 [Actinoplanes campanulatus]GID38311.1 hypothetical protein Aca09nite_48170 [Actinoplanes campanulatus]